MSQLSFHAREGLGVSQQGLRGERSHVLKPLRLAGQTRKRLLDLD